MSALPTDNLERRLLSNSAKLLLLRRQPNAYAATNGAELLMENLVYINQQADASGDTLLSVSSLLIQELIEEIYSQNEPPQKTVIDKAITWHEQARRYIKQPKDSKIISSLISKFPEDMRTDIESYLEQNDNLAVYNHDDLGLQLDSDIELEESKESEGLTNDTNDNLLESESDPWSDEIEFGESWPEESFSSEIESLPQVVGKEFYQLTSILSVEPITDEVLGYFSSALDELTSTSQEAGLDGFILICEFLQRNFNAIHQSSNTKVDLWTSLLACLPDCLMAHINQAEDDALCLLLIEYLAQPEWPVPLDYRDEKNILYGLTRQQGLGEEDVSQSPKVLELDHSHVSVKISEDASPNLVESFFAEADKQAEVLAATIQKIGKDVNTTENIRTAQRLSHTLKGSANLLGVQGIANFAHYLEDIFDLLLDRDQEPSKDLAESMQDAADTIELMIECMAEQSPEPEHALATLKTLVAWSGNLPPRSADTADKKLSGDQREDLEEEQEQEQELSRGLQVPVIKGGQLEQDACSSIKSKDLDKEIPSVDSKEALEAPAASSMGEVLRVPKKLIDDILNVVGEASISLGQMQSKLLALSGSGQSMNVQDRALQSKRFDLEELINVQSGASQQRQQKVVGIGKNRSDFDSLELDQYNEVYGAAHSYIETVSDSRLMAKKVVKEVDELESLFVQQQRLNRSLQDLVMSTRMVTVSTVSARFQRAVRQAARMTGKDAELIIHGESLSVDSDLLNQLVDPIMHLLRNAVDHGIDSKEARFDCGKPAVGQIQLAFRQDGNHLIVKCSDDGVGLNYDGILSKALARGIVKQKNLDRPEIARLILSPGFSTREEITQVSGRGVGMDVVNAAVVSMNGSLLIGDQPVDQSGTVVEIRLPVALLTNHSIIVESLDGQYAIPTNNLEQILTPGAGKLELMGEKLCYVQEKSIYPAITLMGLLGYEKTDDALVDLSQQNPVILIHVDGQAFAVLIDSVVSALELVIKGFGPYVGDVDGISGVSLLGNGDIVPVVDLPQLIRKHIRTGYVGQSRTSLKAEIHKVISADRANVLIVDDSLSTRESLAELVGDMGHRTTLARDGVQALDLIKSDFPDLILTDLEMPKINGLELTAQVRSESTGKDIPIVMISSRSMQKHRDEAKQSGVSEYVTKPFVPEELMAIVDKHLTQAATSH